MEKLIEEVEREAFHLDKLPGYLEVCILLGAVRGAVSDAGRIDGFVLCCKPASTLAGRLAK